MNTDQNQGDLRERLTPEQYEVTQNGGTERAFTGAYWDTKDAGVYRCVVCDEALFDSDTKFDSGTGWPSFMRPVEAASIIELPDNSHGMHRVEVKSRRSGSHLGHVFPDGPPPT